MNNMPTRRNLGEIFSLLRTTPPARPAYTAEEIREIVAGGGTEAPPRSGRTSSSGRALTFITMIGVISGTLIGVIAIRPGSPAGTGAKFAGAGATPGSMAPSSPAMAGDTTLQDMAVSSGRKQEEAQKQAVPAPEHNSGPQADTTPDRMGSGLERTQSESKVAQSAPVRRVHIRQQRSDAMMERPQYMPAPRVIPGARMIELAPEELERINVKRVQDGLELMVEDEYAITNLRIATEMANLGYDTTRKQGTRRLQVVIGVQSLEVQVAPPSETEISLRFKPVLISLTDAAIRPPLERPSVLYFFNDSLFQEMRDEARRNIAQGVSELHSGNNSLLGNKEMTERSSALRNMLPVHIRLTRSADRNEADIYLWYRPTEAFISALPERYRVSLQRELEIIANAEGMRLGADEICRQGTAERSFFDYCRHGAIVSAELAPNPAQGETFCRMTLDRQRTVSMALYDLNGNFIRDLSGPAPYPAGDHEVTCNLENIPRGTYLILLRTEAGEQMVRHLINR